MFTHTEHLPLSASQNISKTRTTGHPEYYTLYLPSPRGWSPVNTSHTCVACRSQNTV